MRLSAVALLLLGSALAGPAAAGEFDLLGVVSARGRAVESRRSWLEGGFGWLGEGGEAPGDRVSAFRGQANLGFDWRISPVFQIHAHGVLQAQPERAGGREAGLVEAFAAYRPELSPKLSLRLKAGTYFPQTSRENVDPLWSSPYTITLSALNTWLGEEVRLKLLLQAAYLDNCGDRELYRGQYSWRTRFAQAGLELHLAKGLLLIAEGASGDTGMGLRNAAHVDMDFRSGYALLTWGNPKLRFSARYDAFKNVDRDGTQEPNGENGHAITLAGFIAPVRHLRIGVEALDLRSERPAAADSGFAASTNARRATLELRLLF